MDTDSYEFFGFSALPEPLAGWQLGLQLAEEQELLVAGQQMDERQLNELLSGPGAFNFSAYLDGSQAGAVPTFFAPAPAPAPASELAMEEGEDGEDGDDSQNSNTNNTTTDDAATDDPLVLALPFALESGRSVLLPKEKLDLKWKPFMVFFARFRPTVGDQGKVKHFRRRYQLRKSSEKGRREQRQRQRELEAQVAAAESMSVAMLARVEQVVGSLLGSYLPPADVAAVLQAVRAGLAAPPHPTC